MPLQLYFSPGACSFVPHVLLERSGAAFEPLLVKLHKGEQNEATYRAINPRGQVPVLVQDGQPLTQIVAITLHLDALFPNGGFLPASGWARSKALETLAWMNNTLHPTFTHIFMPHKFTADADAQALIRSHNTTLYRELLSQLQDLLHSALQFSPWFSGAQLGALDAYSLTLLRWAGLAGIDPTSYPVLWAHSEKVAQDAAVARVMERERLQLNLYRPAAK